MSHGPHHRLIDMFSIVIAIHNNESTLKRTLQSFDILDGRLKKEIEVVVVFDGRDKSCEEIVSEWQSRTSISNVVLHQAHLGVSSARNYGVRNSSSGWITFLDADDEILPERLLAVSSASPFKILIGKQDLVISDIRYLDRPDLISVLAPSEFHIMSMVLSRKTFDEVGGFDEGFTVGGDWDFIVRARKMGLSIEYSQSFFVRRYLHSYNSSLDVQEVRKQQLLAIRKHVQKSKKDD
jgi:glycosyltransferase involved in cell wall biosynthesis